MLNFWWSAEWSKQKTSTEMQKKWKRPHKSSKNKMFVLDYIQLLLIDWVIWAKNINENAKHKTGTLIHRKIKCSFLYYIQLLMMGKLIQTKNIDQMQNNEKGPLSHWKIKCAFLDYVQLLMFNQVIQAKTSTEMQ